MRKYFSKEIIKAIRQQDVEETLKHWFEAPHSTGLNIKDLTINTSNYLSHQLEIDDYATMFNNTIHKEGKSRQYDWQEFYKEDILNIIKNKYDYLDYSSGYFSNYIRGNSYNEENNLGNDLDYLIFCVEGEHYIILDIHLGGDIRGNYTKSIVFKLQDIEYFFSWTIEGMTEKQEFESAYEIEDSCIFNEYTGKWEHEGKEVKLYSMAEGF